MSPLKLHALQVPVVLFVGLVLKGCFGTPEERHDYCMFNASGSTGSPEFIRTIERCYRNAFGPDWAKTHCDEGTRAWLRIKVQEIRERNPQLKPEQIPTPVCLAGAKP